MGADRHDSYRRCELVGRLPQRLVLKTFKYYRLAGRLLLRLPGDLAQVSIIEPPHMDLGIATLSDEKLLDEIFAALKRSISPLADPYSDDGSYATAISLLPVGLRAMAATHHLDVSLTMDDIGWHFLNFGEPGLVCETESGLRELGLSDVADWFAEAHGIVNPLKPEIEAGADFYECLTNHAQMDRIGELTQMAQGKTPTVSDSSIYGAWVRYARENAEKVFGEQKSG